MTTKPLILNTSAAGDPDRARLFVHQLWSVIEILENREISRREFSRYLDIAEPSLSDWTNGVSSLHQIEAVLRLLERVPGRWRRTLLRAFLREHPTLYSPQLAHEPSTPGRLRSLLKKPRGITFILGATASVRGWVFTAVGHYCLQRGPVIGWDYQAADWFVPVPGIQYGECDDGFQPGKEDTSKNAAARTVMAVQMSNGLWLRFPRHRDRLLAAAQTRHVIVADAIVLDPGKVASLFPNLAGNIHILELSAPRPGHIHVEFGAP